MRGALQAEGHGDIARHEEVVHHQDFFPVGRGVVVGLARLDEHVAVQPQVLQDVFAVVRVVPVDPRILEVDLVAEGLAGLHRVLSDAGHAVGRVVEAEAVPVDGRRPLDRVGEVHRDRGRLGDVQKRSRVLAVEAVHDVVAAANPPPHQPGLQVDGVPVAEPDHVAGPGQGETGGVDVGAGQEGVGARRIEFHQRGKHGEAGHHGGAGPAAVAGAAAHCAMLVAGHRSRGRIRH